MRSYETLHQIRDLKQDILASDLSQNINAGMQKKKPWLVYTEG